MRRRLLLWGFRIVALVAILAGFSCRQPADEETHDKSAAGQKKSSPLIPADEFFGLNTRLGAPFVPEKLREELTESSYPVQPSLHYASEKYVSGTAGDGTVYFNIFPDPWEPEVVGSVTFGTDLHTAHLEGRITEEEYMQIAERAKAMAVEMVGDAQYIAKYAASEAVLAARRNPDIATQAGIQIGSAREDIVAVYGEPHETIFEYGNATLLYLGEEAALAFRTGADIVCMVVVFPAKYDYFELRDATRAALESPEESPQEPVKE